VVQEQRDEGIVNKDYFNPIQVPSIALILTAVSRALSFFISCKVGY
jgi:hypothetical protein